MQPYIHCSLLFCGNYRFFITLNSRESLKTIHFKDCLEILPIENNKTSNCSFSFTITFCPEMKLYLRHWFKIATKIVWQNCFCRNVINRPKYEVKFNLKYSKNHLSFYLNCLIYNFQQLILILTIDASFVLNSTLK